jgi:hypothetical protein
VRERATLLAPFLAAAALIGAEKAVNPIDSAEAAITHESKKKLVTVPHLDGDETIAQAKKDLRKAGLVPVGVQKKDGYPNAKPGSKFVADGFATRRIKRVHKNGKTSLKTIYMPVREGSKKPAKSKIYVVPDLISVGANAYSPNAPSIETPVAVPSLEPPISVTPAAPPTETVPPPVPETVPPIPETQPTLINLEAETNKYLASETVQLPNFGQCSGSLIRGVGGNAIGVATANHCLPTYNIVNGSDGKRYSVMGTLPDVRRGEDVDHMSSVGTVDTSLSQPGSNDITLLKLNGASVTNQELIQAFEANKLTKDQVLSLTQGTELIMGGYPAFLPEHPGEPVSRQKIKVDVLAFATVYGGSSVGSINTIVAGVKSNENGATCSPGTSGAPVNQFSIKTDDKGNQSLDVKQVGKQSLFDDFTGKWYQYPNSTGEQIRRERELQYGINTAGYDGLCYISYETPKVDQETKYVATTDDVPGYDGN